MKELPTITGYGPYKGENYGVNALRVDIGPLTLWYSYKTIVAFRGPGFGKMVRENDWGPTTAKHINAIDGGDKKNRVSGKAFEVSLAECLKNLGLEG